jgi:hypothetical protein
VPVAHDAATEVDAPAVPGPAADAGLVRRPPRGSADAAAVAPPEPPSDAAAIPALADAAGPALPAPLPDAAVALGTLQIRNDTWCNLTINGENQGRLQAPRAVRLPPGHYVVLCEQPATALRWRREVDLQANQAIVIDEAMIPDVELLVATPGDRVTIDGATAQRGARVRLKPGQHRVIVLRGDKELMAGWVAVPRTRTCRLHDVDGKLVCDP